MYPMSDQEKKSENELDPAAQAAADAQADMDAIEAMRKAVEEAEQKEAASQETDDEEINLDNIADAFEPGAFEDSAKLKAELEQVKDALMRALADADNTRKRAVKERQDAAKFAAAGFARDMLDIADNLRRALDAIPADLIEEQPQVKSLHEGVEGTEKLLLAAFEKNGIVRLDPSGDIFDPNFHEVMFEAPVPGQPAGTIIEVLEVGYVLNDRLLRPARVGVVKDDGQGGGAPSSDPGGQIDTQA